MTWVEYFVGGNFRDLTTKIKISTHDRYTICPSSSPASVTAKPSASNMDVTFLRLVAGEVGREWKMLARYLGLDEITIESIHQAHFGDLHEASLQSLLKWVVVPGVIIDYRYQIIGTGPDQCGVRRCTATLRNN